MKKFIFKTSIFSLLIFTFLVSVNYFGDSAKLFQSSYENKIAKIIFSNHNATNISNYNERILQKELINKIDERPDILVLGSSRTMLIKSTFFKDKKVINNSVSGASLEDFIAIYQLYKAKQILPKKIILGIDPWLFNKNGAKKRWKALEQEYNSFNNKTEIKECILNDKNKQLFSFSYFQASLSNMPNVILEESDSITSSLDPVASNKIYNLSSTKLVDGSLSYSKKYRETSNKHVTRKAQKYILGEIYSIEQFEEISPRILKEFDKFCSEILDNNIELSFFLAPYHPIVYEKIKDDYQIVLKVENKVLEYAKQNKIKFLGSFSPIITDIDSQGFYDGMHSKENTIKKIMKIQTHNDIYKSLGNW